MFGVGRVREKKERKRFPPRTETLHLFLFQMCLHPHMVLVVAYSRRILAVTRDPPSQTDIILAVLFWVLFNPVSLKFKGHLREQQINPMCQIWHDTMFSLKIFPFSTSTQVEFLSLSSAC